MTDTTTTPENTETVTPEPVVAETETDWKTEAEKWMALSRKNEEAAKNNSAAAQKLAELENANKSEIEKATARAEAAEKERDAIRVDALRNAVALSKGLTPTQAKRLVGTTQEELEADADELLADLKSLTPPVTPAAPSSDGQGNQGDPVGAVKQITSHDDLKSMSPEEIVKAKDEGRLNTLLGIKN